MNLCNCAIFNIFDTVIFVNTTFFRVPKACPHFFLLNSNQVEGV